MSEFIMIKGARVSFPHLFVPPIINDDQGKCGAVLMLEPEKHGSMIKNLEKQIKSLSAAKFKGRKLPSDKVCLRDGEDKGRPEYEGYMVVSTNSKTQPTVIGRSGTDVITDEQKSEIYAGCYVNAKIRLWVQDNQYGKRVNAELVAIQFAGDGEPLDDSFVSVDDAMEGFDEVDTVEDDDFLAA